MQTSDNLKLIRALNEQRQKEMTSDTAKLLILVNQLKAETDKASQDTSCKAALSMNEIRKAELIEKLAKAVSEKMKASVAN